MAEVSVLSSQIIEAKTAGTPVVFIGALGSNKSMWDDQHDLWSGVRPRMFVDQLGHGDSPVPDGPYSVKLLADSLMATIDKAGFNRFHIVGLSLGGAVAQQVVSDHPERVVSVALVSTAAKFGTKPAWEEKATKVRSESTAAIAMDSATRWFTPKFGKESGNIDKFFRMVSACPDEGYAACCEALGEFDNREKLADISRPTLVVSGAQDPGTSPDKLKFIADHVPGSVFTSLEPAAHLCNIEQADAFNAALTEFVNAHDE